VTAWTGTFSVQYHAKKAGIYIVKIHVNGILWDNALQINVTEPKKEEVKEEIKESKSEEKVEVAKGN
jgi:hypothetical protein